MNESVEVTDSKKVQNQSQPKPQPNQQTSKPGSLSGNTFTSVQKKFWDNKQIHYRDLTGESSAEVYDAIKGQKYFKNTYIFVYSTLEDMEGTSQYDKIADTMESTKLNDRIFIWVHLTADKEVIFVKSCSLDFNARCSKVDEGGGIADF